MIKQISNWPIFKTINGRQAISLWASKIFEKKNIKQLFGINLVAAMFFSGIINPEANNLLSLARAETTNLNNVIAADTVTKTTFELPLALNTFTLSQFFTFWHPGIDLASPLGNPIYPIDDGTVEYAGLTFFGYGKHVIIAHNHNVKSLYAHMSEINVTVGQKVKRGEIIGKVGATGWATGNHLHLEIYQNNQALNPLELLPIKPENIKLDGILFQKPATPSPELTASSK